MAPRRTKIFEELGLLAEAAPVNPYETLGISQDFARNMLIEDPSGEAIRLVANSLYRTLSRRYHPDAGRTADEARFHDIDSANKRIAEGTTASLTRWSKVERPATSLQLTRLQSEYASLLERSTSLLQDGMEFGGHPSHFSQLPWAQGALARRGGVTFLVRPHAERGIQILRGHGIALEKNELAADLRSQAFDFASFLKQHASFGIEPGSKILAYIDENGRASILSSDLTFMMDVTEPVAKRRQKREKALQTTLRHTDIKDAWTQLNDPILFTLTVPSTDRAEGVNEAQIIRFPLWRGEDTDTQSTAWNLPMDVAGSITNPDFYNRIRHNKSIGAVALAASTNSRESIYFNLLSTPVRSLIRHGAGYSPLLSSGNSLLLLDRASKMAVVTDAKIIGLVGSNPGVA